MINLIENALQLNQSDILLDAYSGVGTFALLLAPYSRKVIAIEESPAALVDAKINAGGYPNIELVQGKVEAVFGALTASATTSCSIRLQIPCRYIPR